MSIKFSCSCGKRLRAGDEMAGKHTLCPTCNSVVAIPRQSTLTANSQSAPRRPSESTDDPTLGDDGNPILIQVRKRKGADPNTFEKPIWMPLDPDVQLPPEQQPKISKKKSRRRYNWELESHWYQSFWYPLRAWRLLLALSIACGLSIGAAALFAAEEFDSHRNDNFISFLIAGATFGFITFIYTVGLLDCITASSVHGEYRIIPIPGLDLNAQGVVSWALCFLVGPLLPGLVMVWYWLKCGDPDWLDRLILAELGAVMIGGWLLTILAAKEKNALVAGPLAATKVALRLGRWLWVPFLALPALFFYITNRLLFNVAVIHLSQINGFLGLAWTCLLGLFGGVYLLRLAGLKLYLSKPLLLGENNGQNGARAEK